jgi:predicted amidophosphoribosyltransferase
MDSTASGKTLLAYAICAVDPRHFAEGFADIRDAPPVCPVCGNPLHTVCPRCGMLYRTATGICSNCGERLQPVDSRPSPTGRDE